MMKKWRSEAQERLSLQQVTKLPESEGENTSNSPTTGGEWKPFAAFWVEFQRREAEGRAEGQRIEVSHVPVKHGAWLEDKRTEPKIVQGSGGTLPVDAGADK